MCRRNPAMIAECFPVEMLNCVVGMTSGWPGLGKIASPKQNVVAERAAMSAASVTTPRRSKQLVSTRELTIVLLASSSGCVT